jgi:hypothetical protein
VTPLVPFGLPSVLYGDNFIFWQFVKMTSAKPNKEKLIPTIALFENF